MSRHWTETDIPDLHGRTAVVTGASTGLGYEVARMLSRHGATVIMLCRGTARAQAAADRIRGVTPGARVRTIPLNLASLTSVREAAARLRAECAHIDLLVNNAGGINPRYSRTEDGFETTLATNHLGPFALTGLVLDLLLAAPQARTEFGRDMSAFARMVMSPRLRLLTSWLLQSPQAGALPIAFAAADPSVRGGEYYGPGGWNEWTGSPERVQSAPRSHEAGAARRLWEVSEQLTGVSYRITAGQPPPPTTVAAQALAWPTPLT